MRRPFSGFHILEGGTAAGAENLSQGKSCDWDVAASRKSQPDIALHSTPLRTLAFLAGSDRVTEN